MTPDKPELLEAEFRDFQLEELGLLDPGQPTETATINHRQAMEAQFTPLERRQIRYMLGLNTRPQPAVEGSDE